MRRFHWKRKNLTAVLLAAALAVTALPTGALAEERPGLSGISDTESGWIGIDETVPEDHIEKISGDETDTGAKAIDEEDIDAKDIDAEDPAEEEGFLTEESGREDAEDAYEEEISAITEETGPEEDPQAGEEDPSQPVSSLYVGDTDMMTNNLLIEAGVPLARFNPETGVLTLYDGVIISESYNSCIHCEGDLIINVAGDCKLGVKGHYNKESHGIVCYGNLTIRNAHKKEAYPDLYPGDETGIPGSLTVYAADDNNGAGGDGIFCNGFFTISGNDPKNPGSLKVTSTGSKYSGTNINDYKSVGIRVFRDLTVENAEVTASGSESTHSSLGVVVGKDLILNSGSLTGTGGKVTDANNRLCYGVLVENNITVEKKAVLNGTAGSGDAEDKSSIIEIGISGGVAGRLTIRGDVIAKGSSAAMEWSSLSDKQPILDETYVATPENPKTVVRDFGAHYCYAESDGTTKAKEVEILRKHEKATVTLKAVDRGYRKGDTSVELTDPKITGIDKDDEVSVDLSEVSGVMEDDHAGENRPVTVTGVKLAGKDAAKYMLDGQPENVTVNISKAKKQSTTLLFKELAPDTVSIDLSEYVPDGASFGTYRILDGAELLDNGIELTTEPSPSIGWKTADGITDPLRLTVSVSVINATDYEDYTLTLMIGEGHDQVYTVDFNSKYGDLPVPQILEKGRMVKEPEDLSSEGMVFRGWYTEEDCLNKYDFSRPVAKSFTLYAKWEAEKDALDEFTAYFRTGAADPSEGLFYDEESGIYEITYTGSEIKPEVTVTGAGGKILKEGVDYSIRYSGNLNVSRDSKKRLTEGGRAIISGKSGLSGMRILKFRILPRALDSEGILAGSIRISENSKASPTLFFGNRKLTVKDYSVQNANKKYKESGTLTVKGKGNFEGTLELPVTVEAKDLIKPVYAAADTKTPLVYDPDTTEEAMKDAIRARISVYASKPRKGKAQEALDPEECYDLIFPEDVLNAGKKTIDIIGKGLYTGTASVSLTVSPRAVKEQSNNGIIEVGNAEEIRETPIPYKNGGATLSGKLTVNYRATAEAEPHLLVEGTDYKVSYTGNKAASVNGTASYAISFIGNYKGTPAIKDPKPKKGKAVEKKYFFRIAPVSLEGTGNEPADNVIVYIPDMIYSGKAKTYTPSCVLTMNGITIPQKGYQVACYKDSARTDRITSKNKLKLEEGQKEAVVYVTITGRGNYTGTILSEYRVIREDKNNGVLDLGKARITIYAKGYDPSRKNNKTLKSVSYNGEPRKTDDPDIGGTVVVEYKFDGKKYERLTEGKDYELCYLNNTGKGKAMLIVKGLRNPENGRTMAGSKAKTFTIIAANVSRKLSIRSLMDLI
ncbi:MAG: InlB B-repeat-containing protein [Lachnospiraceae bacterium]|nr:InlB B-repeat-containing protein [Lachnospiraceae bacterium]